MSGNKTESVDYENEWIGVDVNRAWSVLKTRLENDGLLPEGHGSSVAYLTPLMRIAALILLLAALGVTAYYIFPARGHQLKMEANTERTEKFGLSLPDGSVVDLNAHSKIRYRTDRAGNRLIKLSGEAFFNVSPEPGSPFVISSGRALIRVSGTAFGVRSDAGFNRVEVYVKSGTVQLSMKDHDDNSVILGAGKMGILDQNTLRIEDHYDANNLAWKTRKLRFRQTSLGEVAEVLNRTYKKEILFENKEIENCLFTGTFDQQPVDSVIRVIQLAFNLEIEQNKNSYVLSGNGCN